MPPLKVMHSSRGDGRLTLSQRVSPHVSKLGLSIASPSVGKLLNVSSQGGGAPEDRAAARRLLRLADPQARLAFLGNHWLFQETSLLLRERLAPQLVRPSTHDEEQTAEILAQGAEVTGRMDYLFLTPPDVMTKIEVTYEGEHVAFIGGNDCVGEEALFGVTSRFLFGARMAVGSVSGLWVIPRKILHNLLAREAHREDAWRLQERSREKVASLFHKWYCQPTTDIKIRLFGVSEHAFRAALVEVMEIDFVPANRVLFREKEPEGSCIFIFRGEAGVGPAGTALTHPVARISNTPEYPAWAAWWGILELLGISYVSPVEAVTITDCIVWRMKGEGLRTLRQKFPAECRLLDKVAVEHIKVLRPLATTLDQIPMFKGADPRFLEELQHGMVSRICGAGEAVTNAAEVADDFFFLARGRASAFVPEVEKPRLGQSRVSASARLMRTARVVGLPEGSCFGEMTALGLFSRRAFKIVCETICDLRVVPGKVLRNALVRFPCELQRFLDLLESRGAGLSPVIADVSQLEEFTDFSPDFTDTVWRYMRRDVLLPKQLLLEQDLPERTCWVLLQGRVSILHDKVNVGDLKAPAIVGLEALTRLDAISRVTARTEELCLLHRVEAKDIVPKLQSFPEDLEKLKELIRQRYADLDHGPGRRSKWESRISASPPKSPEPGAGEHEETDVLEVLTKQFKGAEPDFLEFLAEAMYKMTYYPDQVLMQQGEVGTFALLIYKGTGTVEVNGVKVGEFREGGFMGEGALIGQGMKRTATVRANGPVTAFILDQSIMRTAFDKFPAEQTRLEELMRLRQNYNKAVVENQDGAEGEEKRRRQSRAAHSSRLRVSRVMGSAAASKVSTRLTSRKARLISVAPPARPSVVAFAAPEKPGAQADRGARSVCSSASSESVTEKSVQFAGQEDENHMRIQVLTTGSEHSATGTFLPPLSEAASPVPDEPCKGEGRIAPGVLMSSPTCSSASGEVPLVLQLPRKLLTASSSSSAAKRLKADEWAMKRQMAIKRAQEIKETRLAKAGGISPLLPPGLSFVEASFWTPRPASSSSRPGTGPSASSSSQGSYLEKVASQSARLHRAELLYAQPVWHEVFG